MSYLDQVGNIEAQGEEEKSGTNEPEQCSTMFTAHNFLKIRNKKCFRFDNYNVSLFPVAAESLIGANVFV